MTNKYPDHFSGKRSLAFLYKCYKKPKGRDITLQKLAEYSSNTDYKELSLLAEHFTVNELLKDGDYQKAAQISKSILTDHKDSEYAKFALYNLGNIYYYYLDDKESGETYFREFIEKYPKDDLVNIVLSTLGEAPVEKDQIEANNVSENIFGNYPNLFNPVTRIEFSLPKAVNVKIEVYNSIGQLVKTLTDNYMETGHHEIEFNAKGLASGVYMYRIEAGEFRDVKKMIFIK